MISGETYEELYEILGQMDKKTVMQIPEDILNNIKNWIFSLMSGKSFIELLSNIINLY